MKIRPSRSGLLLLGGYLAVPGVLAAGLLLYGGRPWIGLGLLLFWLAADALVIGFHFGSLLARIVDGLLIVEWGIAFPRRWVIPLGSHLMARRLTTPAMQLLNCCVLALEGPGGRVRLWAISEDSARGLERALRGEQA